MSDLRPDLTVVLKELYGSAPPHTLTKLQGDASSRTYYRVTLKNAAAPEPQTLIVMHLPVDAFKSDEGGASIALEELPFVSVQQLFEERGVPVPKLLAQDMGNRLLLLEDLGDETLESRLRHTPREHWNKHYSTAIELLVRMHAAFDPVPPRSIIARRVFDRTLLRWELDHFREWGLEAVFGTLNADERAIIDQAFENLTDRISALPTGFVHRDYQSRNLMWRTVEELAVIDFQDAMTGPRVYDLVALLCDSYVDVPPTLQDELLERYAETRGLDLATLTGEFWLVALHRKLKDTGRFVFIDRVRGNPSFLRWVPQSLVYVGQALERLPGFDRLAQLLQQKFPGFPDAVEPPAPTAG